MRREAGEGAGWVVVAVLFAATTCVESMSWNQLTAYTPLYLRELHVPVAQVPGWIAAISSLGWVLALPLAPFWGVLADRYSRKLIIVRSAAIEAVIFAGWDYTGYGNRVVMNHGNGYNTTYNHLSVISVRVVLVKLTVGKGMPPPPPNLASNVTTTCTALANSRPLSPWIGST